MPTTTWTMHRLSRSEGSGEAARMCRLAWAFTCCLSDKHQNFILWPFYLSLGKGDQYSPNKLISNGPFYPHFLRIGMVYLLSSRTVAFFCK